MFILGKEFGDFPTFDPVRLGNLSMTTVNAAIAWVTENYKKEEKAREDLEAKQKNQSARMRSIRSRYKTKRR